MVVRLRVATLFVAVIAVLVGPALADVDLSGDYRVDETAFPLVDVCTATVVQSGTSLSLSATCIGGNYLTGSGTIDPLTGALDLTGTCEVEAPPAGPPQPLSLTGTGAADSISFVVSGTCGSSAVEFFGTKCGNGSLDLNEECEDGNRDNGDCCSDSCDAETGNVCDAATPECTLSLCDASGTCVPNAADEAAGAPCDLDADACTVDTCDGAGTCEATGAPLPCELCETCEADAGCVASPLEVSPHPTVGECLSTESETAKFLNYLDDDDKDRLLWGWKKGPAVPLVDFGTPNTSTDYSLCLFGRRPNGTYEVVGAIEIPSGAGWQPGSEGFRFEGDLPGTGRIKLDLRGSAEAGQSRIAANVKGPGLAYPSIDNLRGGQIELRADNGKCWASQMRVGRNSRSNAKVEKIKLRDCTFDPSKCR